jgi:hypothetical protein
MIIIASLNDFLELIVPDGGVEPVVKLGDDGKLNEVHHDIEVSRAR